MKTLLLLALLCPSLSQAQNRGLVREQCGELKVQAILEAERGCAQGASPRLQNLVGLYTVCSESQDFAEHVRASQTLAESQGEGECLGHLEALKTVAI